MRRAKAWVALIALLAAGLGSPAGTAGASSTAATGVQDGTQDELQVEAVPGSVGAATARIGGVDRYEVAVNISERRYADPATVDTVYITRGDIFADALTAGTLEDGPVLLIRADCSVVPWVVMSEIARVDPDRVVALGGTLSVCEDQLLQAAGGRPTGRLEGVDRFETAASIARHGFPAGSGVVYLASGAITPDAVVGGALRDGPILLASRDGRTVPSATAAAVAELDPATVIALGGPLAVSEAALDAASVGRAQGRVAGADRYETAVKIADRAYPGSTGRVYIARGEASNFVDAVAAGMLADGPVLLTPGPCERVVGSTAAELRQRHPGTVVALGGTNALCSSTLVGASLAARGAVDCSAVACVALTFDDGPSWPTPTLLNTLATQRIPVTFFVLGQQVDVYSQHARRAWVEGHRVENHTWDHKELPTLTLAQQQWEVDVTDNELNQHGIPDTTLMRPPYGSYNTATRQLGFPLIMWDVDPRDWDGPPSSATVRSRVVSAVRPGSIVLQHDIHINSVNAVPGIVADLKAAGYTFVTVQELVPGMDPGDLVYRRGTVYPATVPMSPSDIVVTDDGRELGPVVDESGVPGIAPSRPLAELLQGVP